MHLRSAILALALTPLAVGPDRATQGPEARRPGPLGEGMTLLPNGWRIAPAGRHLPVGDLPLAMAPSPDGRFLVITNNGVTRPSLAVVDLDLFEVVQRLTLDHAWLGLAWHPDRRRLFSAGAASNSVQEIAWGKDRLTTARKFVLDRPQREIPGNRLDHAGFVGGLVLSPDGRTLYAAEVFGKRLRAVEVATGRVRTSAALDAEAYTVLPTPDGARLYLSLWGGAKVLALDAKSLAVQAAVPVGEHPNAMALSGDGRLFVACANTNSVWVIDLGSLAAREQVSVALHPNAPAGSTPNALAVSPDGKTLLVANADNNTVAVVDISRPGMSQVRGFIPSGWYPTAVAFIRNGAEIAILSGKGLSPAANPRGPRPTLVDEYENEWIAKLLTGTLSTLPTPDETALAEMTRRVYSLDAYQGRTPFTPPAPGAPSAIPARTGEASPIRHVFYVIRENRTYDQVLGDIERGNGDPNLTLFGEDVTPNAHALAREFVLFDNFYVDAEVSFDGHAFSTAAYATDAVEKLWPTRYGGRGGLYLSEGGWERRNAYGNISAPADGYLWDFAARAGLSVRSYGEFGEWESKVGPVTASVPGLEGKVHPSYPPFDLTIPDNTRADVWLEEFRRFEQDGSLPRLNIVRLGNDHTAATRPGYPTPRAMVGENDLALGRLVEAISHSRYWKESAIFVLEDDAQNGPDHVDAHRSVLLVASPWARRRRVDRTLYTTSGVLRTMELILGLPPMSQYDAAATPLFAAFGLEPDLSPFSVHRPRVPLDERNAEGAPGARASMLMNLEEADVAPELELNQIIWKSVRGHDAVMPPPVRAAFVRAREREEE